MAVTNLIMWSLDLRKWFAGKLQSLGLRDRDVLDCCKENTKRYSWGVWNQNADRDVDGKNCAHEVSDGKIQFGTWPFILHFDKESGYVLPMSCKVE